MRGGFRASMAWLHTWGGLAFGWALFVILLTGSLSVFERAITEWMQAPPSAFWMSLVGQEMAEGARPPPRHSFGGQHFVRMHFTFHADMAGIWIVGLITVGMLTAIATGVVTHARIFRDFFTFRPGEGPRSWRDAHTAFAVLTAPFLAMIAYSGLALFYQTYMPAGFAARYGGDPGGFRRELYAPPSAEPAGDAASAEEERTPLTGHPPLYQSPDGRPQPAAVATRQTMVVLHLIQFGGAPIRGLYFLSGLCGAAGVAAGLTLFAAKRRRRHDQDAPEAGRLAAVVERVSCGVVAGLCVASVAYFWINRLVPAGIASRIGVELALFAAAWALCVAHAAWRTPTLAWREQFSVAALLCLGLPVVNALTSDVSLAATIPAGDWRRAGVDLVALAAGVAFGGISFALRRRRVAAEPIATAEKPAPAHGA